MTLEFLIGSRAFWNRLKPEILAAQKRVYIQTLSFEGDSVGMDLADTMLASAAADRRIVLDCYTRHIISDKWIYSPKHLFDGEFKAEVRSTKDMIARLNANGVPVTFVNPFGPLYGHIPVRNHKKIIIIDDDVCYIGGLNFSDHNFAWHDMMMRIENREATEFLANDFELSCRGEHFGGQLTLDDATIISLDGVNNTKLFAPLMDKIENASKSIIVHSPYLCHPFCDYLTAAAGRGVAVTIISPEDNNKKTMKEFIQWHSRKAGFDLRLYRPGMLHLKAMVIDDEHLVVGSCNFDYFSYAFEQETIAIISNQDAVEQFKRLVIETDLASAVKDAGDIGEFRGRWRNFEVRTVGKILHLFNP